MEKPARKYEIYSHEFKADPYPTFHAMRENDPVLYQVGLDGQTPIWFLTRYAEVEQVLRDDAHFGRDWRPHHPEAEDNPFDDMLNSHMLNRDGADHRRLRTLVTQAFTPKRVRDMRPRIQAIADELLDAVEPAGEMDLIGDFAYHLPTIVISEMLGIPDEDRASFREWSTAIISPILPGQDPGESFALVQQFLAYLQNILAARRAAPTGDMLSALVHAESEGERLNENELYSMAMLLIVAGHETTVNLIANAMVALWRHPDQLELLKAQPELMPTAVEEFLRYDGSVERAFNRFPFEDVELDGQTISKSANVIPILAAANRDPVVFENPDTLDVTRSPNPHLGFGKGAHYCLGAPLARLETEIALNTLLRRMPGIRPAVPPDKLQWRMLPGFRSLEALPVTW